MLMMKERRPAMRTLERWTGCVPPDTGEMRECEERGCMKGRADPHTHDRAHEVAGRDPPFKCVSAGGCSRPRGGARVHGALALSARSGGDKIHRASMRVVLAGFRLRREPTNPERPADVRFGAC